MIKPPSAVSKSVLYYSLDVPHCIPSYPSLYIWEMLWRAFLFFRCLASSSSLLSLSILSNIFMTFQCEYVPFTFSYQIDEATASASSVTSWVCISNTFQMWCPQWKPLVQVLSGKDKMEYWLCFAMARVAFSLASLASFHLFQLVVVKIKRQKQLYHNKCVVNIDQRLNLSSSLTCFISMLNRGLDVC